jgi:hypothetical protein
MAREAGLLTHIPFRSDTEVSVALKAFEALVRADEREQIKEENQRCYVARGEHMTECQHRWEEVPEKLIYKCARCGAFMRIIK